MSELIIKTYNVQAGAGFEIGGGDYKAAQIFLPHINFSLESIKVSLKRTGSPGNITFSVQALDEDGYPDGIPLCSVSTNGNTLPTGSFEMRTLTFAEAYPVLSGVRYAIVCEAPTGDAWNKVYWESSSDNPYVQDVATKTGGGWALNTTTDIVLELWGILTGTQTLKDYHLSGESAGNDGGDVAASVWKCETFTPLSSYSATNLAFKGYRSAAGAGTITLHLRLAADVDGNGFKIPSGNDLATATIDIATLGTGTGGAWYISALSSGVALTAGTRYAILYSAALSAGQVYFKVSETTNYAFGQRGLSSNAGATWAIAYPSQNVSDFLFKVYDASTYTPQSIIAAGLVSGGNHLWKITDNGKSLTVDSSHALAGNVSCMAYSSVTRRVYVGIVNSVYCFDANTMALITAWGTNGVIDIGALVNKIDVDSSDYLAVAHNAIGSGASVTKVDLYDDNGTQVWTVGNWAWTANADAQNISFNLGGNINVTLNTGTVTKAVLLSRTDGSHIRRYWDAPNTSFNAPGIDSSEDVETAVFFSVAYSSSSLYKYTSTTQNWTKTISGTSVRRVLHVNDFDLVVVADGATIKGYYDIDGGTHPWADYGPINSTPLVSQIAHLVKGQNGELYIADAGGFVGTCNLASSCRSSLQVSGAALTSVVWLGDAYFAPTITDQSTDTDAEYEDTVSFFVTVSGTEPLTYQWYKDGSPISGEINSTLILSSVDASDGGSYTCTVTNIVDSVDSSPILLQIYPYVVSQTNDISIALNSEATLTIVAAGFPSSFTYEWYKNDILLSGETSSTLTKFWISSDAGTYKCKITNDAGSTYSSPIVVKIVSNLYSRNFFNLSFDISRSTP